MVTVQTQKTVVSRVETTSRWTTMGLVNIAVLMLIVAVAWRIVDQFVLGLGSTWLNIFPSKLFPFLIILGFFMKFRLREISPVLGLSGVRLRAQLLFGLLVGVIFAIGIEFGGTIIYALFVDSTYPLGIHILNENLLWYSFIFFLTNALLEESLFRGLLINTFKTSLSPNNAILLSAAIFGVWHAGWPVINGGSDVLAQVSSMVFFTMILGILFGVYYQRFSSAKSLVGPITAHTILNFFSENFKMGPEPVIQGPDLVFSSVGIMATTLLMFVIIFIPLGLFLWRSKIEQIADQWQKLVARGRVQTCTEGDNAPS